MALNTPIGCDYDSKAPFNSESDQIPEPETCQYCGELIHEWHRDVNNNIICFNCVQAELKNNKNFKYT